MDPARSNRSLTVAPIIIIKIYIDTPKKTALMGPYSSNLWVRAATVWNSLEQVDPLDKFQCPAKWVAIKIHQSLQSTDWKRLLSHTKTFSKSMPLVSPEIIVYLFVHLPKPSPARNITSHPPPPPKKKKIKILFFNQNILSKDEIKLKNARRKTLIANMQIRHGLAIRRFVNMTAIIDDRFDHNQQFQNFLNQFQKS